MLDEMGDDQLRGPSLGFSGPATNPSNPRPEESQPPPPKTLYQKLGVLISHPVFSPKTLREERGSEISSINQNTVLAGGLTTREK